MIDGSVEHWERVIETTEARNGSNGKIEGVVWDTRGAGIQSANGLAPSAPSYNSEDLASSSVVVEALLGFAKSFLSEPLGSPARRDLPLGFQLLTRGGCEIGESVGEFSAVDPMASQYWGLARVLSAEYPELKVRVVDSSGDVGSLCQYVLNENPENQVAIRQDERGASEGPEERDASDESDPSNASDMNEANQSSQMFAPRLRNIGSPKSPGSTFQVRENSSYLITGGLGMLGRRAAEWLAGHGGKHLVLVSRRGPDEATQRFLGSLPGDPKVEVVSVDMADADQVMELIGRFGNQYPGLGGVIHSAGVLDDGLFQEQDWDRFKKVLAPKVSGATHLDLATRKLDLDFFVLYSSVASILGSRGQSNYAMGNAFMDGLAWRRREMGLAGTSINWGPWSEGMADNELIRKQLSLQGITPLGVDEAHQAMEQILGLGLTQATVLDVNWKKLTRAMGGHSLAMLSEVAPAENSRRGGTSEFVTKLKSLKKSARFELLVDTVQAELQTILSTPERPETDRPLIEMGLDSLMAVEFGTRLQMLLGDGITVAPTMLFDHPTIDAISTHVLELIESEMPESNDNQGAATKAKTSEERVVERESIAIVGMSCQFPGARNRFEFWKNLIAGVDSVVEIPEDRWDIDRFYSEEPTPGKMYTREGGFLDDMGEFDASFFNISEQEACWIDPQHRMLLENSWHALEDAGIAPQSDGEKNVGVFMGIMGSDYAFLPSLEDSEIIEAFQGAGLAHSAGVGRLSFVFGFEGPSVAVDTASSSSLVAVCQAMRALQDHQCNMALAGGVNAILAPVNSLLMSKAGFLSPDGRCKSFSAQADGFGRGEGCGVVVLKRLSDAERDGDRIFAVLEGGAIRHNGVSGGLTTPSGKSQGKVIQAALEDAAIAPSEVQYLEAHGTGTEYGDPMELAAAASVYGRGRAPESPLLVGSVKANISHLEAAGGVSGLIKTALAIHHGVLPRQLHFDEPSPHIPWARLPVQMVTEQMEWPESEKRIAAVTALGLSGTNAHVVLRSAGKLKMDSMDDDSTKEDSKIVNERDRLGLLVVSAKSESALQKLARQYQDYFEQNPNGLLQEVCFSAAVGRKPFNHRMAVIGRDLNQLAEGLNNAAESTASNSWLGSASQKHQESHNGFHGNSATTSESIGPEVAETNPKVGWMFGTMQGQIVQGGGAWLDDVGGSSILERLQRIVDELLPEYGDLEGKMRQDSFVVEDPILGLAVDLMLWDSVQWVGVEPDLVCSQGGGAFAATAVAGGMDLETACRLTVKHFQLFGSPNNGSSSNDGRSPGGEEEEQKLNEFESFADEFDYVPPNRSCVCNISGAIIPVYRTLGGSHWREHCVQPDQLESVSETIANEGLGLLVVPGEVGEKLNIENRTDSLTEVSEWQLRTLGELFVLGAKLDWAKFYEGRKTSKVSLPNYPFIRKRYWITEIAKHVT